MNTELQSTRIRVNDTPKEIAAGATVRDLLGELGLLEKRGVAVALNNEVVPRVSWTRSPLREGDSVLVIQATQGG